MAGANAADGHADLVELSAVIDFRHATSEEGLDPIGVEFFVGGDIDVDIGLSNGPAITGRAMATSCPRQRDAERSGGPCWRDSSSW